MTHPCLQHTVCIVFLAIEEYVTALYTNLQKIYENHIACTHVCHGNNAVFYRLSTQNFKCWFRSDPLQSDSHKEERSTVGRTTYCTIWLTKKRKFENSNLTCSNTNVISFCPLILTSTYTVLFKIIYWFLELVCQSTCGGVWYHTTRGEEVFQQRLEKAWTPRTLSCIRLNVYKYVYHCLK